MAGLKFVVSSAFQQLTADIARSILQVVAPVNQRVKVFGWSISFTGPTGVPVKASVLTGRGSVGVFDTALSGYDALTGSMTVTGEIDGTIQTLGNVGVSVEPTYAGCVDVISIDPITYYNVLFDEPVILNGGDFLSVVVKAPAQTDVRAKLICEE